MSDNEIIIKLAQDLSRARDSANKLAGSAPETGRLIYGISVGPTGHGTKIDLNIGNRRFLDLISQHPCNGEYSRIEVTKLDNVYHIFYHLPAYEDEVGIVTIAHSLETVIILLGQDILENIKIIGT